MSEIIPIRDLKNTTKISKKCHELDEPIFVTKNGYGDMVLMSMDYYDKNVNSITQNSVYSFNEIIRILNPIFRNYNVRTATLFGSYAKGLATPISDIDIMVDSGLKGMAFYGLLDAVYDALQKDVDLIDIREIVPDSVIDKEIKKSGVRIYG